MPRMLLEREKQLSALHDKFEDAGTGTGSLVLLAGEAGSGKTSLVRSFVESLPASALVVTGACDPLSTPRPLSPLLDFAADPNAGLNELLSAEIAPIEMFRTVLDRVMASIRPVVLIVEDVHWADEATLDFIRFLGRRIADIKAMMICTYRDDEVAADHPFRPVLGQLIPLSWTERLVVPPLSADAVASLTKGTVVDPVRLHQLSGGNAFFVTEVISAGGELPATVQDAVLARVATLDPRARRATEAVSVAPRSLEMEKVSALTAAPPSAIDEAVGSGVLTEDGLELRFRHELAREAIERSIPPARRLQLHRQMIGLLVEDPIRDSARLAHHAVKAGDSDLIVEYAPEAAREASQRGAIREAASFYKTALNHEDALEPVFAATIRLELAKALIDLDDDQGALVELDKAESYFSEAKDIPHLGETQRQISRAHYALGEMESSDQRVHEAIATLQPLGDSEELARALGSLAGQHMLARRPSKGLPVAHEAKRIALASGSSRQTILGLQHTIACLEVVGGNVDKGIELLEESVAETARARPGLHAHALTNLGSGAGEMRRYKVAIQALLECEAFGLRTDQDSAVGYCRSWLARVAFEQGKWDEAVDYAELVDQTVLNRSSYILLTARGVMGRVRVRRGDPGAVDLLAEALTYFGGHNLQYKWSPASGLAEYHWLQGSSDGMVDAVSDLYELALDTESRWAQGELGYWMWKARGIDGPPELAAEPFRLQMEGEWREAADVWREIGCPYEVGLALFESGEPEPMLKALEIFDHLGAKPMSDRTRSELRRLGVDSIPRGPAKSTKENPSGLTNRQLEVLDLMGLGKSNAEIADELFISKKTVEHHVSAIYSKLGVDNREDAIASRATN